MKTEKKYRVVKIGRKSCRKQILERGLAKQEAQRMVKSFPGRKGSMVVFYEEPNDIHSN